MRKPEESLWAGMGGGVGATAAGLAWVLAVRVAWPEWELNPQYQYGLAVPFLCAVFFVMRWRDRPAPERVGGGAAVVAGVFLGLSLIHI